MQIDQTNVVIRARSFTEILDLATVLMREHSMPITIAFLAGALPWAIANTAILGFIPVGAFEDAVFSDPIDHRFLIYMITLPVLVFLQTPVAGALLTIYLGRAIFEDKPTWRSVGRDAGSLMPRWLYSLGLIRGPLVMMALMWLMATGNSVVLVFGSPFLFFSGLFFIWLRVTRPFLPEIIVLERSPLRPPTGSKSFSVRLRSRSLHGPFTGELFARFVTASITYGALAAALFFSFAWLQNILLGNWQSDVIRYWVLYPVSLWAVAQFSVVVRLLGYLDTRIRLEGWEVQLATMAECNRQFGDLDVTPLPPVVAMNALPASGPPAELPMARLVDES